MRVKKVDTICILIHFENCGKQMELNIIVDVAQISATKPDPIFGLTQPG